MSTRQQQILAYISDYIRAYGIAPTLREIGAEVGISSTSVVNYHLRRLEQLGAIKRDPVSSRAMRVVGARYVRPGDVVTIDCGGSSVVGQFVA